MWIIIIIIVSSISAFFCFFFLSTKCQPTLLVLFSLACSWPFIIFFSFGDCSSYCRANSTLRVGLFLFLSFGACWAVNYFWPEPLSPRLSPVLRSGTSVSLASFGKCWQWFSCYGESSLVVHLLVNRTQDWGTICCCCCCTICCNFHPK